MDYTDVLNDVKNSALWFLYLALIAAVTSYVQVLTKCTKHTTDGYSFSISIAFKLESHLYGMLYDIQVTFFSLTAQRQAMRIRRLYFQALMRHEQGWYDNIDSGELTSRVAGYAIKYLSQSFM